MTISRTSVSFGLALAVGLAACSSSGQNPLTPPTQANVAGNVLQFAVGTANVYGDLAGAGGALTGLNVVATYRQPAGATDPGASGTAVNSPTLTLPGALPATAGSAGTVDATSTIATGPAPSEVGKTAMTPTAQVGGSTTLSTFGLSGQVSGLGIEPFNYTSGGAPTTNVPYSVPLYDTVAMDPNQLGAAWGGPPAFNYTGIVGSPVGNGTVPAGTSGISEGIDVFASVAPVGGTYTLSVSVPANTGTTTQAKSATLPAAPTVLPAFTPPVPALDANNDGGATFAVTLPVGVTEAYIQIVDIGPSVKGSSSCNGALATAPIYYTIAVAASGTVALGPLLGPGATPSLCTTALNTTANKAATPGDQFTVQGIGFDYPIYEASYPQSLGKPAPTILGGRGEDDITISSSPLHAQGTNGVLSSIARRVASSFRQR